jgi:hypothetical protein
MEASTSSRTDRACHLLAALGVLLCVAGPSRAADTGQLEEPPHYGIYYDSYEPTFYTGFAPRDLDPRGLHLHIGRGNQLRATLVLSGDVLREYAKDLVVRQKTYRTLVDSGRLVLTQNRALEKFERTLADVHVDRLVAEEATLPASTVQERNLQLLEKLNPGRVHRIRIPVDELVRRWCAHVNSVDRTHMENARRLELVNLLLPTRLFVTELDAATSAQLATLAERCPSSPPVPAGIEPNGPAFLALLEKVSHGLYPLRDGALDFAEFTAIYPIGTLNDVTTLHGRPIPMYPTPGRRALTTHQRTLTIDHVPDEQIYSYSPWIPYIHIGPRLHDALHTLFWRMRPAETSFLPPEWRSMKDDNGKPYEYLWLLSRGPMSHGCTHVNAGHQAELRQLLPAEADQLGEVDLFYNRSNDYDVFDIDGDLVPEVMGVKYFIAYSLKSDKPDRLRVRNERTAYYDWLYAGELSYDAKGRGVFAKVNDGRYVERQAVEGGEYQNISLYEAEYEPEKVQFYKMVDIPFTKELRQVSVNHPFGGSDGVVRTTK